MRHCLVPVRQDQGTTAIRLDQPYAVGRLQRACSGRLHHGPHAAALHSPRGGRRATLEMGLGDTSVDLADRGAASCHQTQQTHEHGDAVVVGTELGYHETTATVTGEHDVVSTLSYRS